MFIIMVNCFLQEEQCRSSDFNRFILLLWLCKQHNFIFLWFLIQKSQHSFGDLWFRSKGSFLLTLAMLWSNWTAFAWWPFINIHHGDSGTTLEIQGSIISEMIETCYNKLNIIQYQIPYLESLGTKASKILGLIVFMHRNFNIDKINNKNHMLRNALSTKLFFCFQMHLPIKIFSTSLSLLFSNLF
jgi:hypothetical protein